MIQTPVKRVSDTPPNRHERRRIDAMLRKVGKKLRTPMIQSELRPSGEAEAKSTNPQTPRQLDQRVVIKCPSGIGQKAIIELEDGTPIDNVVAIQIGMENGRNPEGDSFNIFLRRFSPEIGAVVHEIGVVLLG